MRALVARVRRPGVGIAIVATGMLTLAATGARGHWHALHHYTPSDADDDARVNLSARLEPVYDWLVAAGTDRREPIGFVTSSERLPPTVPSAPGTGFRDLRVAQFALAGFVVHPGTAPRRVVGVFDADADAETFVTETGFRLEHAFEDGVRLFARP